MKNFLLRPLPIFALLLLIIFSCKKPDKDYNVPSTYNFSIVNYSGQTQRLNMLEEMLNYMDMALTGNPINATVLNEMFVNENDQFVGSYSKDLRSKFYELDTNVILNLFDSIAQASISPSPGSNGTAGIVTSSSDPTKKYLFSSTGKQYSEQIEKMIMGAVFYYQATAVYMSEDQIGNAVNNETIVPGEGTAMEHHWDEAFGYWGVPLDFPGNLAGLRYFGEYTAQRNAYLKCSKPLMDAFILGRSAISNKDMDTKNAQVPIIRSWWEKVVAACAIHYLNTAKTNIGDDALRNHQLSEAWGFIYMLKYNPAKTISQTQIDALIQNLGGNFYTINGSTIDSVRDQLSTIFQMDAIKSLL